MDSFKTVPISLSSHKVLSQEGVAIVVQRVEKPNVAFYVIMYIFFICLSKKRNRFV